MSIVSLVGDFNVNGVPTMGMEINIAAGLVRFNEASGMVAVIAMSPEGKTIKGLAVATEPVLQSIQQLGSRAVRDENIRMPQGY
jgi:hypothetical protein